MFGLIAVALLAGSWSSDAPVRAAELPAVAQSLVADLDRGNSVCRLALEKGRVKFFQSEDDLRRATTILASPRRGDGEAYIARNILRDVTPSLSSAQFTLAEGLLRHKCVDEADQVYRGMLAFYSGRYFDAVRQRALVGIDDVRAAKGQTAG